MKIFKFTLHALPDDFVIVRAEDFAAARPLIISEKGLSMTPTYLSSGSPWLDPEQYTWEEIADPQYSIEGEPAVLHRSEGLRD